ncbi:MAG: hypothetical protein PHE93_03450 [Clostridia bacterium]|nr:hypothetical protein [Clostridia bacterium]
MQNNTTEKNQEKVFNKHISLVHNNSPKAAFKTWQDWQKIIAWCTLVVVLCTSFLIWKQEKWNSVTPSHGFTYLGIRPGLTMTQNLIGDIVFEEDGVTSERIVFDEALAESESAEEKILLALKLYEIGNLSMVTSPYSGIYSVGSSDSVLLGQTLPLQLQTIEIRDNTTAEYYRAKYQILKPGTELDPIVLAMGSQAENVERKYYKAGNSAVTYQRTNKIYQNQSGMLIGDWSQLATVSEDRLETMTLPAPYTSAGFIGDEGANIPSVQSTGLCYKLVDGTNTYVPRYNDSFDQNIGYEKTDQHLSYVLDNVALQTIKSASVEYNETTGVYIVSMVANTITNFYTCAETRWSLADSSATGDKNANFTKLEVKFELWDNGYFKKWEMWEDWLAANAQPMPNLFIGEMSAVQYYCEEFTYNSEDCDLSRFDFWSAN